MITEEIRSQTKFPATLNWYPFYQVKIIINLEVRLE